MERGIGQLKRRFHVLHGDIRVNPGKTSQIVMVCAALHNLCKERNLELPDEKGIGLEDEPDEPNHIQPIQPAQGLLYRDNFTNLHFR